MECLAAGLMCNVGKVTQQLRGTAPRTGPAAFHVGTGLCLEGSISAMSGALESKLKTAMDESRLLILGAQVLFGFQFQAVFQELFEEVGRDGRAVHCVSLA